MAQDPKAPGDEPAPETSAPPDPRRAWALALPKVELHVHLEGSIQPATALALAVRRGVKLPGRTPEKLRKWYRFENFDKFIQVYLTITRLMREPEDFELATVELARDLARQNVIHAEVTFSPGTHEWLGTPARTYREGLASGRRRAFEEHGVRINWIFDIVRNAADWRAQAERTLAAALDMRGEGVVALGLGGKEAGFPPEPFVPWFDRARAQGLGSAPHAGETDGPASVLGALRALGADRLGHGVRAVEDPAVLAEAIARGATFEVCPASNLMLGVYPDRAAHPLPRLIEAGARVTINTDDPGLFDVSLTDELVSAMEMGVAAGEIVRAQRAAVDAVFLPAAEKAALAAEFERRLAAMGSAGF